MGFVQSRRENRFSFLFYYYLQGIKARPAGRVLLIRLATARFHFTHHAPFAQRLVSFSYTFAIHANKTYTADGLGYIHTVNRMQTCTYLLYSVRYALNHVRSPCIPPSFTTIGPCNWLLQLPQTHLYLKDSIQLATQRQITCACCFSILILLSTRIYSLRRKEEDSLSLPTC